MTARAPQDSVAVLGAGSWGTALAIQFARGGRAVRLWGRDGERLAAMARARRNERYLPSVPFPDSLEVEADLARALEGARDLLIVVPSPAFRSVLGTLAPLLSPEMHVAWATKGFELETGLQEQVLRRAIPVEDVGLDSLEGESLEAVGRHRFHRVGRVAASPELRSKPIAELTGEAMDVLLLI